MTIYEAVKKTVSVRDAAVRYGMEVTRGGVTRCPFHVDRNPSMKLNDDYFFCFGCGARGDVIDLTAKLYGMSSYDAVHKLAEDFGVDYDVVLTGKSVETTTHTERENAQEVERKRYLALTDRLYLYRDWLVRYAPRSHEDKPDPRFVEACNLLPRVEYLVDILCVGSPKEREEVTNAELYEQLPEFSCARRKNVV